MVPRGPAVVIASGTKGTTNLEQETVKEANSKAVPFIQSALELAKIELAATSEMDRNKPKDKRQKDCARRKECQVSADWG